MDGATDHRGLSERHRAAVAAAVLAEGPPPSGCAESSIVPRGAQVLQRALDPRVAPGRILLRHPHDQAPDLDEDVAPAGLPSVRTGGQRAAIVVSQAQPPGLPS